MEIFDFTNFRDIVSYQLSSGIQQKLNLSLALLHNPDLLLLDEPYAGFDWESYQNFLGYTHHAIYQGKCIIMVSHLVYDKHHFDAVLKLDEGIIHENIT